MGFINNLFSGKFKTISKVYLICNLGVPQFHTVTAASISPSHPTAFQLAAVVLALAHWLL